MDESRDSPLHKMHAEKNWRGLWERAIPIAKHAITKLLRSGELQRDSISDDLLQEGYMAAGQAVTRWDPAQGMFATWISAYVRGFMLNHLRSESKGIVGGRDNGRLTVQMEDDLTQGSELDEPAEEIERNTDASRVRIALAALNSDEQILVKRFFGIDCEPEPMDMVCLALGMHRATGWRILKKCLEVMRQLV